MEISIKYNRVYMKEAPLGKDFADMVADVIVDSHGRVKVVGSKLSFYTDLDNLPAELLRTLAERLAKEAKNRNLEKIAKRLQATLDA